MYDIIYILCTYYVHIIHMTLYTYTIYAICAIYIYIYMYICIYIYIYIHMFKQNVARAQLSWARAMLMKYYNLLTY